MINIELLKTLRKQNKMTQKDVAKKINRSHQAYAFYENGTYEPDTETIKKLAELFKVDINLLFGTNREFNESLNMNTVTIYGRGTGRKVYKVSPKRLKVVQTLLDESDNDDDIDF